jgi:diguanylate cyclase (GGDEF)-like protein
VIRHHHDDTEEERASLDARSRELCDIVAAADRLATTAGFGADADGTGATEALAVGDALELRGPEVEAIRDELVRQLARYGGDGEEVGGGGTPATEPPLRLAERLAELGEVLTELRSIRDPDEILPRSLAALHARLGFDRLLYLESAAGGCRLSGREYHDGTSVPVEMRDLDFDLSTHPGLERILTPGATGLLRAESDPDPVLAFLGVRELAAASLTMHGSLDGVLLADTFFTDRELGDEDAALLRVFALSVGSIIENRGLTRQTRVLRRLAEKDELMGIANRRSLMQSLEKEVERARARGTPLSVVMMDVDHFKKWNDRYGHQAGDGILRDLAGVVQATSRDSDVVGRYGGEEFMVVLRDTSPDAAMVYAERLRAAVRELDRRARETYPDVPVTLSIGVTELREDESIQTLIRRVDRALYAAKRRGRDRVCVGA